MLELKEDANQSELETERMSRMNTPDVTAVLLGCH